MRTLIVVGVLMIIFTVGLSCDCMGPARRAASPSCLSPRLRLLAAVQAPLDLLFNWPNRVLNEQLRMGAEMP